MRCELDMENEILSTSLLGQRYTCIKLPYLLVPLPLYSFDSGGRIHNTTLWAETKIYRLRLPVIAALEASRY